MTLDLRETTRLYREFYRAGKKNSSRKLVQPISEALEVICKSDSSMRTAEALTLAIAGRLHKLLEQIHNGTAQGYWVIPNQDTERAAIQEFSQYVVNQIFYGSFNGDVARLQGRQQTYILNTCEFIYKELEVT